MGEWCMTIVRLAVVAVALGFVAQLSAAEVKIASPDGKIAVAVTVSAGRATYAVRAGGKEILRRSQLGVVRDDADFTQGLDVTANYPKRNAKLEKVEDRYEILTTKRRVNVYRTNR